MKKLILTSLLFLSGCSFEEKKINGKLYLVADNPFAWYKGLTEIDKKPQGKYEGMIFEMPKGEWEFHTKGFKHYLLLCNFEKGIKENCKCLEPNSKVRVKGSVFLEELYEDKECKRRVKL